MSAEITESDGIPGSVEHHYLTDCARKLNVVIDDPGLFLHIQQKGILWACDFWALRMLSKLFAAESIIEIGSHRGASMLWLVWCFRPKTILCIDSWAGASGSSDVLIADFDANAKTALDRFGVCVVRKWATAIEAAPTVEDAATDLVFIDGNHTEEDVTEDLQNYWPKVRPGGILCGHDYCNEHPAHLGVVRAVNKWVEEPEVTLLLPSRIFFIRKPL